MALKSVGILVTDHLMTADLLVNAKARRGQEWYELAIAELKRHGVQLGTTHRFRQIDHLRREVQASVARGAELVIVGGGDGTFSSIVDLLADCPTTLGVLPLGTGNAFARDLGIPADVREACRILAQGRDERVDLGRVNDDYFINISTIGLTTRIAAHLTNPLKKRFGRFVYVIALVRAIQEVQPFTATLTTENGVTEFETLQVVIGNGRFHAGPFRLSETSSISEGKLSLYAVQAASKGALIRVAFRLRSGTQGSLSEVHAEETSGGVLVAEPARRVTVDGEINQRTPITFRVQPKTLSVRVPSSFDG